MVNMFSASLPMHSQVARPSTDEEQVAALVATGKVTTSTMRRTVGAIPFNSHVVIKAQHASEEAAAAEKEEASARDKTEASVAALVARAKRGLQAMTSWT